MTPLVIMALFYGGYGLLGILGELSWHLDDYTRDLPPSFLEGSTPSDVQGYLHARRLQEESKGVAGKS